MEPFILVIGAGFLAGAMNALAGGGSFVSLPAMVFAYGNQPSMTAVFDHVGKAKPFCFGFAFAQCARRAGRVAHCLEDMEALIDRIAEVHAAMANGKSAATIFVHLRAHADRRREQIGGRAARVADECVASLFLRPAFGPVDGVVRDRGLAETNRVADDQVRRNR